MKIRQYLTVATLTGMLVVFLYACSNDSRKGDMDAVKTYFEGEIVQKEEVGLYGKLAGRKTTWLFSEHRLKREQTYSGIANLLLAKAGIIVDLLKDSVTLYYTDIDGSFKYTGSCKDYQTYMKEKGTTRKGLNTVDQTFTVLQNYRSSKHIEDSMEIKGFLCDYYLYKENPVKQEVLDAKGLLIKRSLLEMAILNLPSEINFPMRSDVRTLVTEVKNDSILNSSVSQTLKGKIKQLLGRKTEGVKNSKPEQKSEGSQYAEKGINLIKKGIDAAIHITVELVEIAKRSVTQAEWHLPEAKYQEFKDPERFFEALPKVSETEFDD